LIIGVIIGGDGPPRVTPEEKIVAEFRKNTGRVRPERYEGVG